MTRTLLPSVRVVQGSTVAAMLFTLMTPRPGAQKVIRESHEQWQRAPVLALTPERRWCADPEAPGCDFRRPASVRALPDGGLLASDIQGPLRRFAKSGEFVRELGRRGQGPGEYGFVVEAHLAPNGFVTWFDNTQMRFASVSLDGKPGPVTRLMPPPTMANLFVTNGKLVVLDIPADPVMGTMVNAVYRTVPESGEPQILAHVRTPSRFMPGSNMMRMSGPLTPRSLGDVGDAGDVAHTNGASYDVEVFPVVGAHWRLLIDRPARQVTDAERDSINNATLTRYKVTSIAALPPQVREVYEKLPSQHPALSALHVLSDGTIWIRPMQDANARRARWDVFRRDGTRIGQALLPLSARVWDGAADWILVDELNDDDVSTFVRYRVRR